MFDTVPQPIVWQLFRGANGAKVGQQVMEELYVISALCLKAYVEKPMRRDFKSGGRADQNLHNFFLRIRAEFYRIFL